MQVGLWTLCRKFRCCWLLVHGTWEKTMWLGCCRLHMLEVFTWVLHWCSSIYPPRHVSWHVYLLPSSFCFVTSTDGIVTSSGTCEMRDTLMKVLCLVLEYCAENSFGWFIEYFAECSEDGSGWVCLLFYHLRTWILYASLQCGNFLLTLLYVSTYCCGPPYYLVSWLGKPFRHSSLCWWKCFTYSSLWWWKCFRYSSRKVFSFLILILMTCGSPFCWCGLLVGWVLYVFFFSI